MQIFLALGSNEGDRTKNLREALARLAPEIIVEAASPFYETAPKYLADQASFLNAVCKAETALSPSDVLLRIKKIEADMGRSEQVRFGPRMIDIDLLFYGSQRIEEPGLSVPHPGIAERAFVLVPLCDIAPDFVHPVLGVSAAELLQALGDTSADVRPTSLSV
jgi:2-amino-4-hydroxy-6-hydroxymethyldihydropteridine diphosphokinase